MRRWTWILALAVSLATAVHAQLLPRQLPAKGKLGELAGQQPFPLLQINSRVLRLAPGGRIFDEHNRIILHASLPAQAAVYYLEDASGAVSNVYLLRPDELQKLERAR